LKALVLFLLAGFLILGSGQTKAEEMFYDGENVVGFIKDDRGNKYIVIETADGKAKLIKTQKNPEELLKESYGITNKDFQIREE